MVGEKIDNNKSRFIADSCVDMLNFRINSEEHASRIYKAMSLWFKFKGYDGFAKFWDTWSHEELIHAHWSCEYLLDLDVLPTLRPIKEVRTNFVSVKDVVEETLKAEIDITNQCREMYQKAHDKKDFMLTELASKYLNEQREEINKITNILSKLETFGESKEILFEMNEEFNED